MPYTYALTMSLLIGPKHSRYYIGILTSRVQCASTTAPSIYFVTQQHTLVTALMSLLVHATLYTKLASSPARKASYNTLLITWPDNARTTLGHIYRSRNGDLLSNVITETAL